MGLPLKLAVLSAAVMSTAVMFKLLTPLILELTISDLPIIWTSLISWLKPPYLYVVINCIIITIVASSRLQSKLEGSHTLSTFPEPVLLPAEPVKVVLPVELPPIHQPQVPFDDVVIDNESVKAVVGGYNSGSRFVQAPEPEFINGHEEITDKFMDEDTKIAKEAYEELKKSRLNNKSLISMPVLTPSKINQVELSLPVQKPPASARFSHRKPAKATPEGGRTLRVTKPKRQDTLETTWKAITEGRGVPLTRHRKSDTWETHHQAHTHSSELPPDDDDNNNHSDNRMTKSETFSGGKSSRKPPAAPSKLNRSGGSGRLRKEPSLGQEELNRRVEAFIKKFNEDMRLQRQESLNKYMEMINRGAH